MTFSKYPPSVMPGWLDNFVGISKPNEYFWNGNELSSFTEVDITGTTTWVERDNLVSCIVAGMTSGDANCQLIAKTFSVGDAWVVSIIGMVGTTTSGVIEAGIIFTDGTISTSNAIAGHVQIGTTSHILVGRHGTLTALTTAPWVIDNEITSNYFAMFIKLTYQAANTFRLEFSTDGITYHAFGEADISKTMTPTHVGLMVECLEADGAIMTFGPLRKVA